VKDLPGKRQRRVPSYIAFLLLLLLTLAFFPVHVLRGQGALPGSQLATPLQTGTQTIQQATQACLTPSPADYATVQMRAASANGTIAGHVIPDVLARKAVQKERMPGNFMLDIELVFKLRNPDQFSECLASISDPSSPDYAHFLDATTLAPYMPTPGQRASIVSHLSRMGLEVTEGASPLVLKLSGPVKAIEKAFGVTMNLYAEKANAGFYAANSDPMMPQNFASIVNGIMGLDNSTRPIRAEHPCSGPYCPQGIQVGYSLSSLLGNGYDGTGQKVAIVDVPGDSNIQSTINTYSTMYGLPSTTLDIRYPHGPPSSYDSDWAVETALDVEAVHAVAPKAAIVLLYDYDPMNAIDYVATNHLATIVSNSWSYACGSGVPCSDTQLPSSWVSSVHNRLAVDAAQGLTMLFASGDDGARPDGAVWGTEFPASDPYVLAVGGTNLALSGCGYFTCSGYASETGASISGGGYSGYFAEPPWQTSTIGARSGRAVPDISMIGQSPYFWTYLTGSGWFGVYGTSLSTPLWAGFLAIALQMNGGGSFGSLGPRLYQIANSPSYSSIFHDVTSGSNGYSAGPGWDPVTGWGTPIASALAPILANPFVSTDSMTYVQLESVLFTGTGFTPGGSISSCISTGNVAGVGLCVGQPNADSGGNVGGSMLVGTNIPSGPQKFWVADISTGRDSNAVQLTITSVTTVTVTATVTSTEKSTSYFYRTNTTTVTSYTSTTTSTSTIPTVTTVVLVPLTVASIVQSIEYLTSILSTTVTSYTDTQASTSTIVVPTTVVLVPSTVTSTAQNTQLLTSTTSTTVTNYTSTETSTSTILVPTTIVLVPLIATSTVQSVQYLTSTATTTVTGYTDTQVVTSTIPTVTTVVLLPSTATSTIGSTQYLTSTSTTTVTNYTNTSTSTSTSVVYTTVTVSQGGAGADASSPLAYLGFISLLAITAGHKVTAGRSWRTSRSSSGEHYGGYLRAKRTSRPSRIPMDLTKRHCEATDSLVGF